MDFLIICDLIQKFGYLLSVASSINECRIAEPVFIIYLQKQEI